MGDITEIFNILNTPLPLRKAEMTEVLCDLTRNISFFTGLIKDLGEKMFFLTCELLTAEFFLAGSVFFT